MGRITSEQQCVPGYCTSSAPPSQPPANCTSLSSAVGLGYCYDLAGNLTAYSNGFTSAAFPNQWILLSQTFDTSGRLATVTSSPSGAQSAQPLFTADPASPCTAFGALQKWMYGTTLTVNKSYDNRMRVTGE